MMDKKAFESVFDALNRISNSGSGRTYIPLLFVGGIALALLGAILRIATSGKGKNKKG
jgi:hypothetical protein